MTEQLLEEFEDSITEFTLVPSSGGVFEVDARRGSDLQQEGDRSPRRIRRRCRVDSQEIIPFLREKPAHTAGNSRQNVLSPSR